MIDYPVKLALDTHSYQRGILKHHLTNILSKMVLGGASVLKNI